MEFNSQNEKIQRVLDNMNRVMVGKKEITVLSLVALLSNGHVLLEDVPGVGKTMLVRSLAKSIDAEFKRIQFTPDLLPSDITGVSVYNQKTLEFEFHSGPVFGNVILADEINRTSPKTQSSLLEAMEENNVTVDGRTIPLNEPFFVMATQNPSDYEGTYPLPEAQLDRFIIKMKMGYPEHDAELHMLERHSTSQPINQVEAVISQAELIEMQAAAREVHIERNVLEYIVQLVRQTREESRVTLGVSPRGAIALMRAAKSLAFIRGTDYVSPDDVKYLAPFVLSHRMMLTNEALYEGISPENIINNIIQNTNVPTASGIR